MRSATPLVLVVALAAQSGTPPLAATLEELRACIQANMPKSSSALSVELRSSDRSGIETVHEGKVFWQSDGKDQYTLVCLEKPRIVRGLAYLIRRGESGPALWGFLPEEDRVRSVNLKGAARRMRIGRTAISSDDLNYFPINHAQIQVHEVRNETMKGRQISIVGLMPPEGDDRPYTRIVSYVDDETCVPIMTEFHETDSKRAKVVTAKPSRIETIEGLRIARSLEFRDFQNEIVTTMSVKKIELDPDFPGNMFNPSQLGRNRCNMPADQHP